MTTVVLQPASADTFIVPHTAGTNYDTQQYLGVGDSSASYNTAIRSLLKFDLSSIPAGSIIVSATLALNEYYAADTAGVGSRATNLHRILVDWTSNQATWNNRKTATAWGTAGLDIETGDIAPAVSATLMLDGTAAAGFIEWTGSQLIADIQGMLDGTYNNYGWLLYAPNAEYQGVGPVASNLFRSSSYTTSASRPKLTIEYVAGTTETLLDVPHGWRLMVDGADRYSNLQAGALEWTENDSGEIGTLRATLVEFGTALGIVHWQEIVLLDGPSPVWGGYITQATPIADGLGTVNRLQWEITAEGYETLLNRSPRVRYVYNGWNPGDILADLFNLALDPDGGPPAQTEFDTSTHVTTGTWPDAAIFVADGGKLTDIIDTLAQRCEYIWWIDAAKAVHFGPASAATAPFGIKLAGSADYSSYFPPDKNTINGKIDASDIRNVITVVGGTRVSAVTSDTFTGDGSTLLFALSHHPIVEIVSIGVGGVVQSFGTDWYHSFDDYDCLVNYSHGTVRWDTGNAPPNLDTIVVAYRWGEQTAVTVTDAASVSYYGRSFYYELKDSSLTSLAAATAAGNAMLTDYAYGLINGSFTVKRSGIKAGQRIEISYPALSLSGYYQVRRVVGQIRKGGLVSLDVQFGGKMRRFTMALGTNTGGGALLGGTVGQGDRIATPGAQAGSDQYGLQLTLPDYGAVERSGDVENYHIRFKNTAEDVLHVIEAYSDQTAIGDDREVLSISSNPVVDKFGYSVRRVVSQQEAFAKLQAIGGYGLAGQQDANIELLAYRLDGLWDHTAIRLNSDIVRMQQWTGAAEPDNGSTIADGVMLYTDGTWDPGSGEGLYIKVGGEWRPLAIAKDGVMAIAASVDLVGNNLNNIGTLDLEPGGTVSANWNFIRTWYSVNCSGAARTGTLPQLSTVNPGTVYFAIKVDSSANAMIIDGYGSETINGSTTQSTTTQWGVIRVIARTSDWVMW